MLCSALPKPVAARLAPPYRHRGMMGGVMAQAIASDITTQLLPKERCGCESGQADQAEA